MQSPSPMAVVITDTNVLINFIRINQFNLLSQLPGYRFKLPIEVLNEFTDVCQREKVEAAIAAGQIDLVEIVSIDALKLFGELRELMGRGEAACLAFAAASNHYLASDEKKRFRRKAIELIGETKILRTEDLLLNAIRCSLLSIEEADVFKVVLAENRYIMPFGSFSEIA